MALLDGGGNLSFNQTNVPFVLNTESSAPYRSESRSFNSDTYWVVYLVAAFQDSVMNLTGDFDPAAEGGSWASANNGPGGYGVLFYMESMRDGGVRLCRPTGAPEPLFMRSGTTLVCPTGRTPIPHWTGLCTVPRLFPEGREQVISLSTLTQTQSGELLIHNETFSTECYEPAQIVISISHKRILFPIFG
jgi:hypothetical protein